MHPVQLVVISIVCAETFLCHVKYFAGVVVASSDNITRKISFSGDDAYKNTPGRLIVSALDHATIKNG